MTMLRELALASIITLASGVAAYACSCRAQMDEHQLADAMGANEVRIVLPVEHRMVMEDSQRGSGTTVLTTHRVLDPLGLPRSDTITTRSAAEDGGSCGQTAALGVVQALSAYRSSEDDRLYTGGCTDISPAFAARFQEDGVDRRIPSYAACRDLDTMSANERRLLRRDLEDAGENSVEYGTETDNPMCEYYEWGAKGAVGAAFAARLDAVRERTPGRVRRTAQGGPREDETAAILAAGGRYVFGVPVHSVMTAGGERLTRVLVTEDFGEGLPRTVELRTTATEDSFGYEEIEVGVRQAFTVDTLGQFRAVGYLDREDPALFEQLMGQPLPQACIDDRWENEALCDPLLFGFGERLYDIHFLTITPERLQAALKDVPSGL